MLPIYALDGMPSWLIVIVLLAIFGAIVIIVMLLRKYAKPFKSTEKPKSDKEIAQEEVARLTKELDENEFEDAKARKERKEQKPSEEEALNDELARMTRPVEDENAAKAMENFDKENKEK